MKIKNIFLALGSAFLVASAFTSCSEDEKYDFDGIDYNRIYFNNPTTLTNGAVVKTPVGNFASLDAEKTLKATAPTTAAVTVNFEIDNSLIAEYNEKNKTEYKEAPAGVITLSTNSLTIKADTTATSEGVALNITEAGIEQLESGTTYLVPVRITGSTDANFKPSSNMGVSYYLVSVTSKLINDEGTLEGMTRVEPSGWTVTTDDAGASNLGNAVDGDDSTHALFSVGNPVVTIDLGAPTSFKGIEIYSQTYYYGYSDVYVEYSDDNVNWNGIGTLEFTGGWSGSGVSAALYGSVTGRYIRLTGNFYYGDYARWNYCRIYEFKLFN